MKKLKKEPIKASEKKETIKDIINKEAIGNLEIREQ